MALYFQEHDAFDNKYKTVLPVARGRVLDIGCGAGRFALYLQQQGFEVIGIDESRGNIADILKVDATRFEEFDTLLLFGYNLGIGGTSSDVRELPEVYYPSVTRTRGFW
jgi:SAM-dependent methyltransferase